VFSFDTASVAGPLIFADQFIEISSATDTGMIYGLGEHRSRLLHNASAMWQQYVMWNRDQPPRVYSIVLLLALSLNPIKHCVLAEFFGVCCFVYGIFEFVAKDGYYYYYYLPKFRQLVPLLNNKDVSLIMRGRLYCTVVVFEAACCMEVRPGL